MKVINIYLQLICISLILKYIHTSINSIKLEDDLKIIYFNINLHP